MSSQNVQFPIAIRQTVTAGRWCEVINEQHTDESDVGLDFSGYILTGEVRTIPDSTGTLLGALDFSLSTLAAGIVVAVLSDTTATAIEAGAIATGADGTREAYADVKAVDSLGRAWTWYSIILPVQKGVTA